MRLFLDTEFNGFGGELISMALISEDGREWYEVLAEPHTWNAWVFENVFPKLGKDPIGAEGFHHSLECFLSEFPGCEIIADWPSDFEHLCAHLNGAGRDLGWRLPIECTMRLVRGDDTIQPENPHNALSDARALRDWWIRQRSAA